MVDQLLKSLLSKSSSSVGSKRRRRGRGRNTNFIDEETEDDLAVEMLSDTDAKESPAEGSVDMEDSLTSSSSVISFDENFSMPTFDD